MGVETEKNHSNGSNGIVEQGDSQIVVGCFPKDNINNRGVGVELTQYNGVVTTVINNDGFRVNIFQSNDPEEPVPGIKNDEHKIVLGHEVLCNAGENGAVESITICSANGIQNVVGEAAKELSRKFETVKILSA